MKPIIGKIHDETAISMTWGAVEHRIAELNSIPRGWAGYFDQGPVLKHYRILQRYTERRIRRWLVKKHKRLGRSGYRLYLDAFLYGKLGLHPLATQMADVSSAKAIDLGRKPDALVAHVRFDERGVETERKPPRHIPTLPMGTAPSSR